MSVSGCDWEGILTGAKFSASSIAASGVAFVSIAINKDNNYPAADGLGFRLSDGVSTTGGCHVEILIDHA
jgi:hypothetical protein